ncbi:MAG: MarR family transcriptional regulator [Bacteroidota bacterium]|nr:MarR family transcriptional regulator [Bacteroidota bacterium]MDP4192580.1 MarR family transcriptional regulator [Bacteroidota bacterium]MDP4196809.1 MarR family transcriptional regulator [Bacteroidota bacterium]
MQLEKEIQQTKSLNNHQKAILNIIFTNSWLSQRLSLIFKPYDLTQQQYNLLRILRGQYPNPATVKLLKDRMLDKMSDVSRLVEKLRIKGFVERNICPKNRRNVDVCITEKGLELLAKMDRHEKDMENILSKLNEEELIQLNILFDKLRG